MSCGNNVPNELQIGGEFWNAQAAKSSARSSLRRGYSSGANSAILRLATLGPTGDHGNQLASGQAQPAPGGSPGHTPFSLSGPLESFVLFWIFFYLCPRGAAGNLS